MVQAVMLALCEKQRSVVVFLQQQALKIILNRLKPQAEKIIAEEKTGFRAGRSKLSTNESSVRNISSTSKTSTMSS